MNVLDHEYDKKKTLRETLQEQILIQKMNIQT